MTLVGKIRDLEQRVERNKELLGWIIAYRSIVFLPENGLYLREYKLSL